MMVMLPLFDSLGDWLLRGLAVIGAAALGGFGAGLIVQLAARMTTTQPAPRSLVRLLRVLGAITAGLLVAFLLFHGAGGGGPGKDGGKDAGKDRYASNIGKDAAPPKADANAEMPASATELRIVVVLATDGRSYRVEGEAQAHTFDEVQALLTKRLAEKPPLKKLVIVVYEGSSDKNTPIVKKLKELAYDHGLTPEISEPKGKAP